MGFEVLSKIASLFNWIAAFRTSSEILAIIGFALVGVVAFIYVGKGVLTLGKWLVNLKVKEFTIALAVMGIALIAIAILIP
ncbi:MAG: hypothetical protein RMH77_03795 [Sulfolobales archaeon]|nr:hypothetical protein [Sulfolobales archaeon]MCX8185571.1 hypothetical protein [Sulfolobales archaeon]MDW7969514.1 hypothetical protein [Sulfolobales archaeon]